MKKGKRKEGILSKVMRGDGKFVTGYRGSGVVVVVVVVIVFHPEL